MKQPLSAILLAQFLCMGKLIIAQSSPTSFAYLLQANSLYNSKSEAVNGLATSGRDWIVLDTDFSNGNPWTTEDLNAIRAGKPGRKVISYLSIGEAENYRDYWQSSWSTNPPEFLLSENPDWPGNYKVKHWHSAWQNLILDALNKIMALGFDGLYLDIIDGFEFFEQDGNNVIDNRPNPDTNQSYRRDMVDWVKKVATEARKTKADAIIIPQNGAQLLEHEDYRDAISAIGIEDVFTDDDKVQENDHTNYVLGYLSTLTAEQKPVLDVEYPTSSDLKELVRQKASENCLVWDLTNRKLTILGESGK